MCDLCTPRTPNDLPEDTGSTTPEDAAAYEASRAHHHFAGNARRAALRQAYEERG